MAIVGVCPGRFVLFTTMPVLECERRPLRQKIPVLGRDARANREEPVCQRQRVRIRDRGRSR
jgi:hypothetical protein